MNHDSCLGDKERCWSDALVNTRFDVKVGAVLGAVLLILCRLTFFLGRTYLWIVYLSLIVSLV